GPRGRWRAGSRGRKGGGEGGEDRALTDGKNARPSRGRGRDGFVRGRYSEVSARYSAFALVPVKDATTDAAFRGWAPASTSLRRASTAGGAGGASAEEPRPAVAGGAITSTISPFGGPSA